MPQLNLQIQPAYSLLKTKKDRLAYIRQMVASNEKWALKALERIYQNQTADEQNSLNTKHHNNIGFTGPDAEILSSYAQQARQRGWLTDPQMRVLYKKMPKYAKQLDAIAQTLERRAENEKTT